LAEEAAEASLEAVAKRALVEQPMCEFATKRKTCFQGSASGGIAPPPPQIQGCPSQHAMEQSHA
jgi:hypothetical protein